MSISPASSPSIVAYIALGANLGERASNLTSALRLLDKGADINVLAASSFFENPAVGGPADSPPFLNAVAQVQTILPPRDLLDRLLEVERALGRVRTERWGPRVIDLDLILYGNEIIDLPALTVPHPRMHERRFVMAPLAEIAPSAWHPVLKQTAAELLVKLDSAAAR